MLSFKRLLASTLLVAPFATACVDTPMPAASSIQQALGSGRYIVKYNDAAGRAAAASAGRVALDLSNRGAVAVEMSAQAAAALANTPGIAFVEEDPIRRPSAQEIPYGIPMVMGTTPDPLTGEPTLLPSGGSRVEVCIIDSGLDTNHEDFAGIPVSGTGVVPGNELCGHGTHVAGTVAAALNDLGVVGVAPNSVELKIVQVFAGENCGWSYASGLVAALDECLDGRTGPQIVSMSLGGSLKSRFEDRAFADAHAAGVLSIAAAGNDGNTRMSYPASYASVMSVAAIDRNKVVANFSQQNSQVEIAAPGVDVLSTVPFGPDSHVLAGTDDFLGAHFANTVLTGDAGVSAELAVPSDVLCGSADTALAGKIALCKRGTYLFDDKVRNAIDSGAVGVIIYNNADGDFSSGTSFAASIPGVSISGVHGANLAANYVGATVTLKTKPNTVGSFYEAWNGTSMATPHVSGAAALLWSYDPSWSNQQIRDAINATAEDLGTAGRDAAYGNGLVNVTAALAYLQNGPSCVPTTENCTNGVDDDCDGAVDAADDECNGDVCIPVDEKGKKCSDGIDNDCDGKVDAADEDCGSTDGGGTCKGRNCP